jgi:predicted RNA-binding Zn-ribbon protein involved in translation (DUF1610 family)
MFWDIETSLMKVGLFSLYGSKYISHDYILQDWNIICACWKFEGSSRVYSAAVTDDEKRFNINSQDDYYVVKKLRDVLENVDILVAHNGDAFDLKKFNARLIYHRLAPLPNILTVDTLKQARKVAKFSSNRLDYLGKHLGLKGKLDHESGLWQKALEGDKKSIKAMVKYNKRDVILLEDVYKVLLPYMKGHPNIADIYSLNCPKCNSSDIIKHKTRKSASGLLRDQYQCKSCGGYFTTRKSKTEKSLSK